MRKEKNGKTGKERTNAANRKFYKANKEKILAKRKTPEGQKRIRESQKKYLSNPKNRKKRSKAIRKCWLKAGYGISLDQYDKMFQEQNGVCAICGKKETSINQYGVKRLAVDHDHKTGKIRGLLCFKCNVIIGHLGEDWVLTKKITEYIHKHNGEGG